MKLASNAPPIFWGVTVRLQFLCVRKSGMPRKTRLAGPLCLDCIKALAIGSAASRSYFEGQYRGPEQGVEASVAVLADQVGLFEKLDPIFLETEGKLLFKLT